MTQSRLFGYVERELDRQGGFAPVPVVKVRIYKHYHVERWVNYAWMATEDAIAAALQAGLLARVGSFTPRWITLPQNVGRGGQLKDPAQRTTFERKREVYARWKGTVSDRAGMHGQELVRTAMRKAGYVVPSGRITFPDIGEVDALGMAQPAVYAEVKNSLSECYMPPSLSAEAHMDHDTRRIHHLFTGVSLLPGRNTPVLVAPMIDQGFYGYQMAHDGKHCPPVKEQVQGTNQRTVSTK